MAQRKTTAKKASVKSAPKKQTSSKSRSAGRKPAKSTRGRRSAPKKTYEDSSMTDEIIRLIVIAVSIVALISLFTDKIGIVGTVIGGGLKGLLGIGAFFLPFIVIAFCIWILFSEERRGLYYKLGGSVLFII